MFYKETNFKETPIGKIPEDWEVIRLEKICTKITDGTHKTPKYVDKGIPFISTQNLVPFKKGFDFSKYEKYISQDEHEELIKRCKPERGDILISKCGTIGRTKLVDVNYEFSIFVGVALLKLKKDLVSGEYLEQLLNYEPVRKRMEVSSPGSTRKTLTIDAIERLPIPLPPLEEQKAITHILSTVDEAVQKADEIIAKTEKLKKGLMQELLTKGIGHKEFKYSKELGCKIPKEWEVVKLGEVVEIHDNKRIPLSEMERSKRKGPYPYCGATGIIDWIDEHIFDGEFILLVEDGGPFGKFENKAYIMTGKFWVNNHAHVLKVINSKGENRFLLYLLNFLDLNPYIVGSTRKKLNQEHMKRIVIPFPSINEQQKIVEILLTVDKKLEIERKRKEKLERIKKALMDLLLTGKIRVEVIRHG